ncbi:MAG TPA: response regulator [Longimicrobium sp.]|jgi:DNA-binding response OmpR family regulator|uniref:response regulator n=1 Tax=Longimicrobium sp. TaxID=2029185 RepID=UPI002ED96FA8
MAAQRILVIEDETGAREALKSLLDEEGYTVCTAEDGRKGLERLSDFHPDTVVCDFYLPDIDGLQVVRAIRSAAARGITVIIITAGCGGEEAESILRREADFFFQKPLDLRRFRDVLQAGASPTEALSLH